MELIQGDHGVKTIAPLAFPTVRNPLSGGP